MKEGFSYSARATGAKDRQARTHEILSSAPTPGMRRLSTSPTARSRMESAGTPNGRGISPNPMARPLKDSHSIPTRLSTSPTARSRGSNLDDTLSLAENEKRVSLTTGQNSASLPSLRNFRKESSTTISRDTSPTAAARPQKSYADVKLEHLKLQGQQSGAAKTLFKAEWKSFGLFGCLADHTMNECINLMTVCWALALTRNLVSSEIARTYI